jgi:hypothetical protein
MSALIAHLAGLAATYAVTKVTAYLGGSLWGRIVLAVTRRKLRSTAAETALEKLAELRPLSDEELARLTPDERQLVQHSRK